MPDPMDLTSSDNPRVKAVVRLREQKERRATGQFVAEGLREIARALAAGLAPSALFYSPAMLGVDDPRELDAKLPGLGKSAAVVYRVTEQLLGKMAYCQNPEGILGVFAQPQWRLEEFGAKAVPTSTQAARSAEPDLWLVAVGTQKPGNLGAMARSAAAAGATGLLVADAVVDAFNPNAIRASTGAVFSFPIISAPAAEVLAFLARRGAAVLAATPDATTPYTAADLGGPVALLIGPEDTGLAPDWLKAAAQRITIPMPGRSVDSLNASAAAAVLLFEALRQRALVRR